MEWKFESGIVASRKRVLNSFDQRVYYVRYKTETNLRRLITASFTYSKIQIEDKEKFIESLVTKDKTVYVDSLAKVGKPIPKMSKVVTIMDFDISEKDQQPKDPKLIEREFELMTNLEEDDQVDNYLSLKHFEANLRSCGYEKCICTLTNDEECKRRIDEILANPNKETAETSTDTGVTQELPSQTVAYLRRILELETLLAKQTEELNSLKESTINN